MKTEIFPGEESPEDIITYKRRKHKAKRQDVLAVFPSEEVHHELSEKEQYCSDCHEKLKEIGSWPARKELVFIPAQLKRLDHIQHAYKCEHCSLNSETDKIIKAPVPKTALAHSYGSSSIIAHTIYQKYELKVPAYRQENDWQKLGLPIHRQDLINWHMKVTDYYFKPVYSLLKEILLTQAVLHADETSYRVLESDTQKTYYWTFLSGKQEKKPITFYHHDPHRSSQVATDFLGNYSGYLHCDMWQAYKQLPEATLVGCWAHVRRKFKEAVPPTTKGKSLSKQGVHYCNQMFTLEKSWENLSNEERHQKRQEKLKPLFDEFFKWCRTNQPLVLPGSKLGRAIAYALNHEDTFKNVLLDGKLVLSNNLAERAIKTLVIGRKNWLFSQSFEGAQSSAIILSLIETAKRNNLDPEKYIEYLLDKLPNEENLTDQEHLSAYLPWTKEVQEKCKTRIEQRKAA